MLANHISCDNKNIVLHMAKNNYKKLQRNQTSCKNKVIDLKLIKLGTKIKSSMTKS